ncbi:MAG: CysB family HTH-type transcriptional regulator, partial [Betaproteobacteria bacterium]|nr:CysB family HTH-type transcriptional regulator [Betaproteobacteria bacterium]
QQLRYLCEIARRGLSISDAALALHTSQPGVSKQILALEDELGVKAFVRRGKRLTALTPAGKRLVAMAEGVLAQTADLKRVASDFQDPDSGEMVIATTHTQARYVLPKVIPVFLKRFPKVSLFIHQGNPVQVADEVASGRADIGIATEYLDRVPELVTLPYYRWNRVLVAPKGHPVLNTKKLRLADIAAYPLVSYDLAFTGRGAVNEAFAAEGITPTFVLSAMDSDVLKTYVELGIGIGLLAEMAFDPATDRNLAVVPVNHLFSESTTKIALKRGAYLRSYTYALIELMSAKLTRKAVDAALSG